MGVYLAELIRNFDSGEIRLPLMQRDYVWPRSKVLRLLDSLYKQWPIGAFYIWRTAQDYPMKNRAGLVSSKNFGGFRGFLLDGQQRLTSLSNAVRTSADGDLEQRAFFDLENERFFMGTSTKAITKRIEGNDPLLIPLSDLLLSDESEVKAIEGIIRRVRDAVKCNSKHEEVYRERLHRVAKMYDCDTLCEIFPEKPEQDAFELFSRLNKGGMSLSSGDVEGARLASSATKHIVEPMRAVAAEPGLKVLGINFIFLLRCLVTVHRGSCTFSKLPKHWADDPKRIAASWDAAEQATRKTAELVRMELGWASRKWLPSTMALIPVVYLLSQHPNSQLSDDDRQNVVQYLLVSGLRGIFRGTTETTVNSYVNAIRKSETNLSGGCVALLQKIPKNQQYKIRPDEVRNSTAMSSPLIQLYLAMLVRNEARSWPSGRLLRETAAKPLPNDPIAVHHIFPRQVMQKSDVPAGKVNTMANYAIVTQSDNLELGDREPFEVWRNSRVNQQEWQSEQLCITLAKEDLLETKAFEEFIEYRADQIANRLNQFLGFGVSK